MQEIVIKLTDDMYQAIKDGTWCGNELWWNALKNGTPLPKSQMPDKNDIEIEEEIEKER